MKIVLCVLILALPLAAATSCEDLAKLQIPNATITAQSVAAGTFTPPDSGPLRDLPAFCRVSLTLKPAPDSDIKVEVWLPASGWNGKYQGVGNGGFAGAIGYPSLGQAITHGYAASSTDTGHHAGGTDAAWALGHPDKMADFGYRAIHETAEKSKTLIAAFYGDAPKHSYFNSCSNGGRQALMEAQRFPADYDGIVAGAPANVWTRLMSEAIVNSQAMFVDPASYVPSAKLAAVSTAVLASCDAADGVKDGVIENPATCHFDPSVLLCKDADNNSCLTAPQVKALKTIYGGLHNAKGETLLPGYSPGGEAEAGGWAAWITGTGPQKALMYSFGTQFYMNMLFSDPKWDYKTFNVDRDLKLADEKIGSLFNATDPDLSKFKARGGKLIITHGWSDAAIPGTNAINYYESVVKKMGAKNAGDMVRLFMVPGMQHCGGGSGANNYGLNGVPLSDADHDIEAALERWVEKGTAPQQIIASKNLADGAKRTHPLCAYPQTASYKGTGSTDDAANYVCK